MRPGRPASSSTRSRERFGAIRPANALVQAGLIGEPHLVEIEAEVGPDPLRAVALLGRHVLPRLA